MALEPLRFNTFDNVRKSLARLKKHGLISIEVVKSHDLESHYEVRVDEKLADELVVANNGHTYFLSDALNYNYEQAANMGVVFATRENQNAAESVIRNRPLAKALSTLQFNQKTFSLELQQTHLFPFPTIFPVITQDETNEEELVAKDFRSICMAKKSNNPYSVLVPNKALEQLHTHATKTKQQLENYELGLLALSNHQIFLMQDDYKASINENPEFKNLNTKNEIVNALNTFNSQMALEMKLIIPVAIVLAIAAASVIALIALPLVPVVVLMIGVATYTLINRLENKRKEKNIIAKSIIDYKKIENELGDTGEWRSRLSRKKTIITCQSQVAVARSNEVVEPAVQPKRYHSTKMPLCFARLFKKCNRTPTSVGDKNLPRNHRRNNPCH